MPLGTASLGTSHALARPAGPVQAELGQSRFAQSRLENGQGEIIVTLDADTYVEPGALAAIRDGFIEDPALGIAGGVLVPVCRRTPWAGFFQFFQTFEYARGFLWRLTWMQYDMLLLISGAFAAYRRTVLDAAGGFDTASWVEDYELTHRVYRDAFDHGQRCDREDPFRRARHDRCACRCAHLS